jgi:hypothetical protein
MVAIQLRLLPKRKKKKKKNIKKKNARIPDNTRFSCIIWISSIYDVDVNELNYLFLSLLVNYLSRDCERHFIRNILIIASTHMLQKVDPDPALIAPNKLNKCIYVFLKLSSNYG